MYVYVSHNYQTLYLCIGVAMLPTLGAPYPLACLHNYMHFTLHKRDQCVAYFCLTSFDTMPHDARSIAAPLTEMPSPSPTPQMGTLAQPRRNLERRWRDVGEQHRYESRQELFETCRQRQLLLFFTCLELFFRFLPLSLLPSSSIVGCLSDVCVCVCECVTCAFALLTSANFAHLLLYKRIYRETERRLKCLYEHTHTHSHTLAQHIYIFYDFLLILATVRQRKRRGWKERGTS